MDAKVYQVKRRNFLLMLTGSVGATVLPLNVTNRLDARYGATDWTSEQITATPAFPVQQVSQIPSLDLDSWSLTLIGAETQTRTWAEISLLPSLERAHTIACVGNPAGGQLIGNALWRGVRLQDVLAGLPLPAGATHAKFTASDGYQTALPLEQLWHDDALLAYAMNGEALPQQHGFPLRLLVSGVYGQKMPKWIQMIELINSPFQGYWESRGWSSTGIIQTHAAFTSPPNHAQIHGGVRLQGYALSAHAITQVEISVEGGLWQPAQLLPPSSPQSWTRWAYDWYPEMLGTYQIEVRATDATGFTQSERPNPFLPRPQYEGNHQIHGLILEVIA